MLKCKICEKEFEAEEIGKKHYVVKTESLITNNDMLFDAFDCPVCKCQNILGERKRALLVENNYKEVEKCITNNECEKKKCFGEFDILDIDCVVLCDKSEDCLKCSVKKHEEKKNEQSEKKL